MSRVGSKGSGRKRPVEKKDPNDKSKDWYPPTKAVWSRGPGARAADNASREAALKAEAKAKADAGKPAPHRTGPKPETVHKLNQPAPSVGKKAGAERLSTGIGSGDADFRAGFACFVGRPNAGKSTLTNALVGAKIAITSNKPQTTRHIIRGVVHRPGAQLILVDTPGLHRPRTLLGERLNDLVRQTWSEVDVIGLCIPADEDIGKGDTFITSEISELKATMIAVVTKTDLVSKERLTQQLLAVAELGEFAAIVPVSAVGGSQVEMLLEVMTKYLPKSPQLYPDDALTDEPENVLVAELIREAALEGVRDELPHSITVLIQEVQVEKHLTRIFADLYVERDSQKAIIIGHKGSRLADVGRRSREEIEKLLGTKVYLDLHVRVAKDWQRDPKQLRKLGF